MYTDFLERTPPRRLRSDEIIAPRWTLWHNLWWSDVNGNDSGCVRWRVSYVEYSSVTPKFITKARMMMAYHPVIIMAYLSPWGIRDTPPWWRVLDALHGTVSLPPAAGNSRKREHCAIMAHIRDLLQMETWECTAQCNQLQCR